MKNNKKHPLPFWAGLYSGMRSRLIRPFSFKDKGLIVLGFLSALAACKTYYFRSNYGDANRLIHETRNLHEKPFLKAHMKNGDVYILRDSWKIDTTAEILSGTGIRYNFRRTRVSEGKLALPFDSISLFETNTKLRKSEAGRLAALGILTGLDVFIGVVCLTNPKACFGSCPTFYQNEKDNFHFADAEGFSNAISPSLEYGDIDALNNSPLASPDFTLTMKNEALETHCVKDIKLLAVPRQKGERIYQSRANQFYRCTNEILPFKATAPEGDVTRFLKYRDRIERFSKADPNNMKSREEIVVEFENVENKTDLGLLLTFRQTLMTTFFIYNAIAYMGDEVSDLFARLEKDGNLEGKMNKGLKNELGDLDVYVWNESSSEWIKQGGFYETGPIALNRQILPLSERAGRNKMKVKLVMNKGLWRIDGLALTTIKETLKPAELSPVRIESNGEEDKQALNKLHSKNDHLISMPGDEFNLRFRMPEANQDYELFLYSNGYYLEWMRENWLKDKNLWKLYQMVEMPKTYLKQEARAYSEYERTMEQEFWNSKIDTKTFSYNEN